MSNFTQDLAELLQKFDSAPVLFVGSGISRRYIGLPSWTELLEELANKTNKDYAYYRSNADGNLPQVASLLTQPLQEYIWDDENSALALKHKDQLLKLDSALKILVSERMLSLSRIKNRLLKSELDLFKNSVVDAIITTNYDTLLEELFPDYNSFVGQDELLFSDTRGVGEIYMIHGSAKRPNSIILTSEDFEEYNSRNAYLAAKLMTLFAEHPVIFLGYSLSDPNVSQILESLVKCVKPEHISRIQGRMFFVHWNPQATPSISHTVMKVDEASIPVVSLEVSNFKDLFAVLGGLRRKFSAKVLRGLKSQIYELVLKNDPKNQLFVADFEGKAGQQPDVVFGVGAIQALGGVGYEPLTRNDLIQDVLYDNRGFDPEQIVLKTMPKLVSRGGNFPSIKYLLKGGFINSKGELLRKAELSDKLLSRISQGDKPFLPTKNVKGAAARIAREAGSFKNLAKTQDLHHTLLALPALPYTAVNAEELRQYLEEHEKKSLVNGVYETYFVKAVCLYERLRYLQSE